MVITSNRAFGCAAFLAAIFVFSSAAHSAITFFGEDTDADGSLPVPNSVAAQSSFLAQLVGVTTEDFEGIAVGTNFPFNVMFGPDTATFNGTNTIANTGVQDSGIGGRFAISGDQYLNVGTGDSLSFNLVFSSPQAAFGFFATDIGDFGGQLTLSFDGGPAINVPHTVNAPDGSALFWGIIDVGNPFTTVAFSNTIGSSDAFGFDDLTIGRVEQVRGVVPEPTTLALWSLGALTFIGVGWRRRRFAA